MPWLVVLDLEFELGFAAKQIGCDTKEMEPLCHNLDFLLVKNKDDKEINDQYRSLVLKINELRKPNRTKLLS